MSGARITIDGLWRCLCPSIDAAVTRRITSAHSRPQARTPASAALQNVTRPRCLHTTGRRREKGAKPSQDPFASLAGAVGEKKVLKRQVAPDWLAQEEPEEPKEQSLETSTTSSPTDESKSQTDNSSLAPAEPTIGDKPAEHFDTPVVPNNALESQEGPKDMVQRLVWGKRLDEDLPRATTEEIYETLRKLRTMGRPTHRRTTSALVKHLLATGTAPDTFLYETLLMAHAATDGSADAVKELLREMRHNKLPWSSTAYHAALQV